LSIPKEGTKKVQLIDSTGKEYWFHTEAQFLAPGFFCKKWSKKKIIDLYNSSLNSDEPHKAYSTKSLPNKKLTTVIREICESIAKTGYLGRNADCCPES